MVYAKIASIGASIANSRNIVLAQTNAAQANGTRNSQDPAVTARLQETINLLQTHHLSDPSYLIGETLANPAFSQAQKDEYIARLIEIAGFDDSRTQTLEGAVVTREEAGRLRSAFEAIGDAWSGGQTPELREQLAAAIGRGVDSGRISANDLHNIVDPRQNAFSDGARSLLTEITDGSVLDRLSRMLLNDARSIGRERDPFGNQVGALVAAADVANLAAAHGRSSAANAVLDEITSLQARGEDFEGFSITDAMMTLSLGDNFGGPEAGRSGFEVLSGLLNSARANGNAERQATLDSLFAELVRSGEDSLPGGVGQFHGNDRALGELGEYFNANIQRLVSQDWNLDNTGEDGHQLVQDFVEHVLLNEDYPGLAASASSIGAEMRRLGDIVRSPSVSDAARLTASESLATLMGSLQEGGRRFVVDGRGDAQARVDLVRTFTDQVTDSLTSRGGFIGDLAGGAAVDSFWGGVVDRAEAAAQADVDDATGDLVELGRALRAEMIGIESDLDGLLSRYDNRLNLYFDETNGG